MTRNISSDRVCFIYFLIDPFDMEVKYVGQTINKENRYKSHLYEALNPEKFPNPNMLKNNWIKKLYLQNMKPIFHIEEEIPFFKSDEREKYWIKFFGRKNLKNMTDGGKGVGGQRIESCLEIPVELMRKKLFLALKKDMLEALTENIVPAYTGLCFEKVPLNYILSLKFRKDRIKKISIENYINFVKNFMKNPFLINLISNEDIEDMWFEYKYEDDYFSWERWGIANDESMYEELYNY